MRVLQDERDGMVWPCPVSNARIVHHLQDRL